MSVEPPRKCSDCPGCRKCSSKGQQYTERDIKSAEEKVLEKSVTTKEVSRSSTSEEESKGFSDLKAASNSNGKISL